MAMKRLNWLKWLRPGAVELQTEQLYWNDKRRRHMSNEHSEGIVEGLEVTEGGTNLHVDVAAGRAIAPDGNDIVIESVQDIDLSSYATAGGLAYIVAEFDEIETDSYYVPEIGSSQSKYYQESPTVSHQSGAPSGNQVEIARVQVSASATDITAAADPLDPQDDEINLLNRTISQIQMDDVPLGYKALDPSGDSVVEQMALLGCQDGDKFWLRPGTYDLGPTAGLQYGVYQDNITIEGPRNAVVEMDGTGGTSGLRAYGSYFRLRGITIELTATADSAGTGITVNAASGTAENPIIEDVKVIRTGSVFGTAAVTIGADCNRAVVRNCELGDVGQFGILTSSANLLVERCTFELPQALDFDAWCVATLSSLDIIATIRDCSVALTTPTGDAFSNNRTRCFARMGDHWLVENCRITGSATPYQYQRGIVVVSDNVDDWTVRDCYFEDLGSGIHLTGYKSQRTLIERCTFIDMDDYGVYFDCDDDSEGNTLKGCYFEDCADGHIYYDQQVRLSITDNVISESSSTATCILVENTDYSCITQNKIIQAAVSCSGIALGGSCSYMSICENVLKLDASAGDCTGIDAAAASSNSNLVISSNNLRVSADGGGSTLIAIKHDGAWSVINDNQVTTVATGGATGYGIDVDGTSNTCNGNSFASGTATAAAVKCDTDGNDRNAFVGNVVSNTPFTNSFKFPSAGDADYCTLVGNVLSGNAVTGNLGVNSVSASNTP